MTATFWISIILGTFISIIKCQGNILPSQAPSPGGRVVIKVNPNPQVGGPGVVKVIRPNEKGKCDLPDFIQFCSFESKGKIFELNLKSNAPLEKAEIKGRPKNEEVKTEKKGEGEYVVKLSHNNKEIQEDVVGITVKDKCHSLMYILRVYEPNIETPLMELPNDDVKFTKLPLRVYARTKGDVEINFEAEVTTDKDQKEIVEGGEWFKLIDTANLNKAITSKRAVGNPSSLGDKVKSSIEKKTNKLILKSTITFKEPTEKDLGVYCMIYQFKRTLTKLMSCTTLIEWDKKFFNEDVKNSCSEDTLKSDGAPLEKECAECIDAIAKVNSGLVGQLIEVL